MILSVCFETSLSELVAYSQQVVQERILGQLAGKYLRDSKLNKGILYDTGARPRHLE